MSDSNRWKWGIFSWYEGCTSCLLLLVVTLRAERRMGGEETERERQREGKTERKSELFSQTWSLSLTKLQTPKPQCCSVPEGTTLQKLTSKRGWSRREKDRNKNKPCNLTVTPKKRGTFCGLNLLLFYSTNQPSFNFFYLIGKVIFLSFSGWKSVQALSTHSQSAAILI